MELRRESYLKTKLNWPWKLPRDCSSSASAVDAWGWVCWYMIIPSRTRISNTNWLFDESDSTWLSFSALSKPWDSKLEALGKSWFRRSHALAPGCAFCPCWASASGWLRFMCTARLLLCVNSCLQISHTNGFLPGRIVTGYLCRASKEWIRQVLPLCLTWCFFKLDFSANPRPHWLHTKGRSPRERSQMGT